VVFRTPNTLGHFRLGITLKARGTSVGRNRVKRAIREAMRKLRPLLGQFDYNVVVPFGKKLGFEYARRVAGVLANELPGAVKKNA
jgi:ribonuclease P protein component